ncbi:MAG TPA: BON domain-containing protein [Gammaproteobacteria bacterium]|nr:BON domain-containing protein [Gammaproteobacteria bacterium]
MRRFITVTFLSIFMFFSASAFAKIDTPIDDSIITTKIKSKIAMEKALSIFKIGVTTVNGIVTLTGKVNSDADASKAIEIAQATDGVKDVDASQLNIAQSSQPVTDVAITAKVKGMFIKEKLFGDKDISAMSINVETNNGIVYLTGKADNQQQIDNAIKIAESVNGVKKVDSRVTVKTS